MASVSPSCARAIRREWKAPLTASGTTFLAPRADARSMARASAILSPLTTIWSSELMFAISTPASCATCATVSSSRPMMAAIEPGRASDASCISRPRSRTRRMASAKSITPPTTIEVYSPRLWPATAAGWGAALPRNSCHACQMAMLTVIMAGWAWAVSCNSSVGPSNISRVRWTPRLSSASAKTARADAEAS